MAHIKCKYRRWRCYDGTYEHNGNICEHHNGWGNGYEYDESCDYADCRPYQTEDGMTAIPFQCRYVGEEIVMFEKNVKSWELDNDELKIGRQSIDVNAIRELIIDGETIIKEQEHESEDKE